MLRFFCLLLVLLASACGDDVVVVDDGGIDGGTGECEPPFELCGSRCINTMNDARHCGECSMQCAGGAFCSMGSCAAACGGGLMACGSSCADLQTDRTHCGGCDQPCSADQDCRGGRCGCPEGYSDCGGECKRTDDDRENCGMCGRVCDGEDVCRRGSCSCPDSAREDDCTNGADDDCDGLDDCEDPDCDGATRACMGACGAGIETCGGGDWGACAGGDGGAEICGDGIDQDCDGMDETNPDEYEPNDTCDTCTLISPMTDPMVTIVNGRFDNVGDNVDCYRFIADDSFNSCERVRVTLDNIPAGHDYDIYLYRGFDDCESRNELASSINFGSAVDSINWLERFGRDDGGTYYIRVRRVRGNSCDMNYRLEVEGLTP